jgi:hypothetical protein
MPSDIQHIERAEHNERLLLHLQQQNIQSDYVDWYVPIACDAAIHYIEALFYKKNPAVKKSFAKHSYEAKNILNYASDHDAREWVLNHTFHTFKNIYKPYLNLYQLSQTPKYVCYSPKESDWSDAKELLETIKNMCKIA